jgi:hypothetical protein
VFCVSAGFASGLTGGPALYVPRNAGEKIDKISAIVASQLVLVSHISFLLRVRLFNSFGVIVFLKLCLLCLFDSRRVASSIDLCGNELIKTVSVSTNVFCSFGSGS